VVNYKDIKVSGHEVSLSKLTGKKILDIHGMITYPFNKGENLFQLTEIVFEDGSKIFLEGEHDCPYIPPTDKQPNLDEDTLNRLKEESNKEE
jgi:hypothetical protein